MKSARLTYYTLLSNEKKIIDQSKVVADNLCAKLGIRCPMCTTEAIKAYFFGIFRKVTVKYYFGGYTV